LRRKKFSNDNFQPIPEKSRKNGLVKFTKKPKRPCVQCKRGYFSTDLNTFSKINEVCGGCPYYPHEGSQYEKNAIWYKKKEQDVEDGDI